MSYKRKDIIEYETFDYYSIEPKDINELYNKDKEFFRKLLTNKSLYVLCFMELDDVAMNNEGIWEYYILPNDEPTLDFKYEIKFNNIISAHKIPKGKYSLHYGISKISMDDYIENYVFFNDVVENFLIIADDADIYKIDNKIDKLINESLNVENNSKTYFDFFKIFEKSDLNNFCTIIRCEDDEEYKIIKILYKDGN
jgi:hypothetical protein